MLLGFLQGAKAEVTLDPLLRKRLEVIGSVMRTRALAERIPLVSEFGARVSPWFNGAAANAITAVVGATYPFAAIAEAHAAMEADENFGKIVLAIE